MPEPGSAKRRRLISRMRVSPASRARQGSPELERQAWREDAPAQFFEEAHCVSIRSFHFAGRGKSFEADHWRNQ